MNQFDASFCFSCVFELPGRFEDYATCIFVSIRLSRCERPCGVKTLFVIESRVESSLSSLSSGMFWILYNFRLLTMSECGCLVVVC